MSGDAERPRAPIAEELAHNVVQLGHLPIPAHVRRATRLRIVDTLGCMAFGADTASARGAVDLARQWSPSGGRSTVLPGQETFTAPWAAFANAVAAHSLELDDAHDDSSVQPGAGVVATALALAEAEDGGGDRLLRAVLAGYEVSLALGMWFAPSHKELGHHPTATLTTIGATASACVARGVDVSTARAALAIVTSMASGLLEFALANGTVNHLHTGKAALLGLLAVDAAERGFTGPSTAFEGRWGLQRTQTAEPRRPWPSLLGSWRILDVTSKPYPTCRATHAPIAAAEKLHRQLNWRPPPDDVIVRVPRQCFGQTNQPAPRSLRERQFSTQFAVAAALRTGGPRLEDFWDESRVATHLPLVDRVRLTVDESAPASERSAHVIVRYPNGEILESRAGATSGAGEDRSGPQEETLRRRFDQVRVGLFDVMVGVVQDATGSGRARSLPETFASQWLDVSGGSTRATETR